ncbi:hypothetical protein [Nocardia sp. NBC_01009]|nr:hypothetical protein OHA42_25170 [Nocardia sp. NBC_01009]
MTAELAEIREQLAAVAEMIPKISEVALTLSVETDVSDDGESN